MRKPGETLVSVPLSKDDIGILLGALDSRLDLMRCIEHGRVDHDVLSRARREVLELKDHLARKR